MGVRNICIPQDSLDLKTPNQWLTESFYNPNVSTTLIRQWGFWQCLPFSWTTLRGKHCRHPIAIMRVVDRFRHCSLKVLQQNKQINKDQPFLFERYAHKPFFLTLLVLFKLYNHVNMKAATYYMFIYSHFTSLPMVWVWPISLVTWNRKGKLKEKVK